MKPPVNFFILLDLERAFRLWRASGKRNTFGNYCQMLRALGYRLILALLMSLATFTVSAMAGEGIRKDKAIDAIIGEAEGECQQGKLAIACTLRNRGTLKGVYGVNAQRVVQHKYSPKTFVMAVKAWEDSSHKENCAFLKGATGWGNTEDLKKFARHSWWKKCHVITGVGGNWFFICR